MTGRVNMKTGALALLLWPVSGLGVTAGAHRYWTHRSYKATSVLEILGSKLGKYWKILVVNMGVSKNRGGPPKSSISIGFSIINHPFWGPTPIFGNTHVVVL